jgi:pimeloyl-ACP methyl ester carboxylesterase
MFEQAQNALTITTLAEAGYAAVNGLNMYYEIHGQGGRNLVLLHGGLGSTDMFSALIPALAQTRTVIAVDLQAHGRTADIDRPLSFEGMADDVAALISFLALGRVDIAGYSLGGGVALQTAIRHPELVSKLVLLSASSRRDGWFPEVLAGMAMMTAENAHMMCETPMYKLYSRVAPQPEKWSTLIGKLGQLLGSDYDWSADVAALTGPVLFVVGDNDSVRLQHTVEMFGLLGGGLKDGGMGSTLKSQLAILPGTLHWNILMRADLLLPVLIPFLTEPVTHNG